MLHSRLQRLELLFTLSIFGLMELNLEEYTRSSATIKLLLNQDKKGLNRLSNSTELTLLFQKKGSKGMSK